MTNTVTNILSRDEELALRKPIEDYVGKIQAEIDELREEGTNKVLEYSEEIEVLKRDKIYRLCAVQTVVSPTGNINNNNYNNSNGVRPFCITQAVRVGSKPKSEKDTKKCMTFHDRVNTKELLQWTKMLYAATKICIRHIEKPRLAKVLMEVVQNFRP